MSEQPVKHINTDLIPPQDPTPPPDPAPDPAPPTDE